MAGALRQHPPPANGHRPDSPDGPDSPGGPGAVLRVQDVRFEHHREALGVGEASPRLSWRFSASTVPDWIQASYHVEITRPPAQGAQVFAVQSSQSVLVPWPDRPLRSGEAAVVRVRAVGRLPHDDPTPWSAAATVEAGLLHRGDWTCALVSRPRPPDVSLPKQPVLFRRCFALPAGPGVVVRRARLYITAHGVYEAHINGQRVGDHVLAPGWTSYRHHLAYQTFDVTDLVRAGGQQNVLSAQVGEGWFCGRLGFLGGVRNIWGDRVGLIAQLVVETGGHGGGGGGGGGGSSSSAATVVVGTDSKWRCGTGSILRSELYDGEVCDLGLEPAGWRLPGFDDAAWALVQVDPLPSADLVAPDGPPVRAIETLPAVSAFVTPSGKLVVDFAQNLVGRVRLRLRGAKGQTVQLQHAEELEDGEVATRPLRLCEARDTVVLAGGDEDVVWEPTFTFHGFRYVQLDGLGAAAAAATDFDLGSVTAVVVHTDMEPTGWFACSEPLLNKLHSNIRWSMRGNFLSVPTDCPQRDERLGWTGDIHVFGPTANYLYGTAGMLQGWLKDLAAEQGEGRGGPGVPPFVCPNVLDDPSSPTAIWGDVVVGLPWALYWSFGDRRILQRQLPSMRAWVDEGVPRDPATGLWRDDAFQFGDWLDPSAPPDDPGNAVTDPLLVANAYLVHTTALLHDTCRVLGHATLAQSYAAAGARLRAAFRRRYVSEEGRVVGDSQTGLALCIHFGLLTGPAQEATAAARLQHLVLRNARFKIATGFAGTPVLGHALSRVGAAQLFYRMLYHRKVPSWLYQVAMGATTVWERWDSKLPDGRINPGEMTSFNHYALGAVADWMHRTIAGLSALEPGWKRFRVAPVPGGDLTHARATFLSPYGTIAVAWTIRGARLVLTVQVPPNSVAEVSLPGKDARTAHVGSGFHEFQTEYERPPWPPLPIYPPHYPHDDDEP